jgi:hypothetical protein
LLRVSVVRETTEAGMNNVQERLMGGAIAPLLPEPSGASDTAVRQTLALPIGTMGNDGINVMRRPMAGMMTGGAMNLVSQLLGIIQQLVASLGFGSQPTGPQTFFASATASSTGDPHLALDGTDADGNAHHAHSDSMKDITISWIRPPLPAAFAFRPPLRNPKQTASRIIAKPAFRPTSETLALRSTITATRASRQTVKRFRLMPVKRSIWVTEKP